MWHGRYRQVDHLSSVARHFADQRRLGANFFFSGGQGDLGLAENFFTTIALQIAHALAANASHQWVSEFVALSKLSGRDYFSNDQINLGKK
jgi:hypothetical protein